MELFNIQLKRIDTNEYAGLPVKLECKFQFFDRSIADKLRIIFGEEKLYLVFYRWGIGGFPLGSLKGKVLKKEAINDWYFNTFGQPIDAVWDKDSESPNVFDRLDIIPIKLFETWDLYFQNEKYVDKVEETVRISLHSFVSEWV